MSESHANRSIRILLADDHDLVRAGFRSLLCELQFQVVAEANNGNEALRLIERHRPDVVLMDIAMPELNGLEATARVAQNFPGVRVIILSMHANAEYARRALRAGASGYLLKNSRAGELEQAIRCVVRGDQFLSPVIDKFLAGDYAWKGSSDAQLFRHLTPRQLQVLQLLARGYTRKQIAEKLGISPKTFDTFRAQIMELLDIQDAAGLVRFAIRMGLMTPDD